MSQAQQPEALRLADALTIPECTLEHGDCMKAGELLRTLHARVQDLERWQEQVRSNSPNLALMERAEKRVQELEAEVASERRHKPARDVAAVRTLAALGYDWHGGEQWKPPLQERKPLTDGEIIAAQERLIAAKDELYRSRIGLTCAHCKTGKYRADGNGYHDFHRCDSCRHVPMFGADGKEFGIQEKHG